MPRIRPLYTPDYFTNSEMVLNKALRQLPAYKPWQSCDPGQSFPVDERYARMPALTKADIRRYFPKGFVPADRDVEKGLAAGDISFVNSSGSSDARVTNIWNQVFWDASEKASWKLNSHMERCATGEHREALLVNP